MTRNQAKNQNPSGKGGFGDHPEHRNKGRWKKENSFSYWLNFFKHLTIKEFQEYKSKNPKMSMAALGAYARVGASISDLKNFEIVANRTEGMPRQSIEYGIDESITELEIRIIKNKNEVANLRDRDL